MNVIASEPQISFRFNSEQIKKKHLTEKQTVMLLKDTSCFCLFNQFNLDLQDFVSFGETFSWLSVAASENEGTVD